MLDAFFTCAHHASSSSAAEPEACRHRAARTMINVLADTSHPTIFFGSLTQFRRRECDSGRLLSGGARRDGGSILLPQLASIGQLKRRPLVRGFGEGGDGEEHA